ncbi:MAG TPA: GNAT family N-acetyltransferase [Anaerolineales bacterium]|nr:GNAT family N-acetyltransferase [Anaerolineales bacterium]
MSDFESVADFLERSFGYTLLLGGTPAGIAYGSLVNSRGLEVSVFIAEPYRRQGIATALAGRLVLECLRRGLRPNWDAANPESCALAEKLGFTPAGSYVASHQV